MAINWIVPISWPFQEENMTCAHSHAEHLKVFRMGLLEGRPNGRTFGRIIEKGRDELWYQTRVWLKCMVKPCKTIGNWLLNLIESYPLQIKYEIFPVPKQGFVWVVFGGGTCRLGPFGWYFYIKCNGGTVFFLVYSWAPLLLGWSQNQSCNVGPRLPNRKVRGHITLITMVYDTYMILLCVYIYIWVYELMGFINQLIIRGPHIVRDMETCHTHTQT